MKRISWIIIPVSLLLLQCVSSSIVSSWQDSQLNNLKTGRIVVVGLLKDSDRSLQRQMENHLADDLCNLGYDAIASFELYGSKAFEGKDEKKVITQLKQDDLAAVLTIVLLNKRKENYHAPKSMFDLTDPFNGNDFSIYYAAVYSRIYQEGYYINDTYYFWESNLFIMPDQKLIYSAQTQSFNPSAKTILANEYGKLIIHDMLENKIIENLRLQKK
jgi:hypothetical protein